MQISFLIYQNVLFCCSDGFVITGIRCFSLGLPMKNNLCFSFVLHLPKFQVSSRYPLLVPVYHTVGTSFCRAVPVMYCICSLKSQMTKCSQTVTIFRWCSNVFCTRSKLGLFTQPSHLLRKKTPFQGRNTTSSFLVPSGKNKLCNRVNVLSLYSQTEVPTLLHLKTCLLQCPSSRFPTCADKLVSVILIPQ